MTAGRDIWHAGVVVNLLGQVCGYRRKYVAIMVGSTSNEGLPVYLTANNASYFVIFYPCLGESRSRNTLRHFSFSPSCPASQFCSLTAYNSKTVPSRPKTTIEH